MKLIIKGENLKITPKLRKYVRNLINKLERPDAIIEVQIKLGLDKGAIRSQRYKAEFTVFVANAILRSQEVSGDIYRSLDLAEKKMINQINKYKKTVLAKRAGISWIPKLAILPPRARSAEIRKTPKIVKRKSWSLGKPMMEDEAVEQMELLAHDWFIFKNKKTKKICVLYRRKDGNYGVVEVK
jgi:putative sigma-54 modulation protein